MSCGIPDDLRALVNHKKKTGKTKDVMGSESESTDNYMDNQCNACWWLKPGKLTSWGWEFLPIILRSFIHPTACRISEPSTVVNSVRWHTGQSLAFFWAVSTSGSEFERMIRSRKLLGHGTVCKMLGAWRLHAMHLGPKFLNAWKVRFTRLASQQAHR